MRRISIVLIVIVVALVILAAYVYLAKPTVVLPTVTMNMPENSSLAALQRQLNINQLSLRARTDGKIMIIGDGKELGYMSYNLSSLNNAVQLGEKIGLTPSQQSALGIISLLVPDLRYKAFLASNIAYFVLPFEVTVQFVRG